MLQKKLKKKKEKENWKICLKILLITIRLRIHIKIKKQCSFNICQKRLSSVFQKKITKPNFLKKNKLLDRDFGDKNIDELVFAFENAKTDEEFDEEFDKTETKLNTLKKLVKIVPNKTEKERTNNVIKSVDFILNQISFDKNVNYSDSDNKQNCYNSKFNDSDNKIYFFDSDSNAEGSGLKILTSNQILIRLPITLAQLKAGHNSEKLKNEIRRLLYSLYRSKKPTKQLYKSLIDII